MSISYRTHLEECERGIRAGQVPEVKSKLLALRGSSVPREFRLPFANLCRRVGLNEMGLRLLAPIVRPDGRPSQASPGELAEYAVLLQRMGVLPEAFGILRSLDTRANPETLLFQAYCHFNRWEYAESIPLLEEYINAEISEYSKLIGRVNLTAALVARAELQRAEEMLAENIALAEADQHLRLAANCREIRAQIHIHFGRVREAEADLAEAYRVLGGEGTIDEAVTLKWKAVLESVRTGSAEPLRGFRARAQAAGRWEAVRDADLKILRAEFDLELFRYHLFGSPWPGYREHAQRELRRVMSEERYQLGQGSRLLRVPEGDLDGVVALPMGGKLHAALSALTEDFYRPLPVGALFAQLFPDEHFNVFTSPNRVHQILHRLRAWTEEHGLEIGFRRAKSGYLLQPSPLLRIEVTYERRAPDADRETLRQLREGALPQPFTVRDLRQAFSMTPARARSFLSRALEAGQLTRLGAGPNTRYVVNLSHSEAA